METIQYQWGHSRRFNDYSTHFRNLFDGRVQKVSVDAGFTCPNRDGTKGKGGCTYCNNKSFKPTYCDLGSGINRQLNEGIDFFARKYETMRFLAYFQAYTNTYAPIDVLRKFYYEALGHPKVIGLVVATRPDCLGSEVLDLLAKIASEKYVMVELGIESHLDRTLTLVNRGHTFAEAIDAIEQISKRGLNCCIHTILGLPGESHNDLLEQATVISKLPVHHLKLHQLQIQRGTLMAKQYEKEPEMFSLFKTPEEYIEIVVQYLELLNPDIVVERFVSQSPKGIVLAPDWGIKNFEFVARLEKRLKELDCWQGKRYLQ